MKTEKKLLADIDKAQASYLEIVHTKPAKDVRKKAERVRELKQELSDLLSEGAKDCPDCKVKPHGMRKSESIYEVGCLNCEKRARGGAPSVAVERWNDGELVK